MYIELGVPNITYYWPKIPKLQVIYKVGLAQSLLKYATLPTIQKKAAASR